MIILGQLALSILADVVVSSTKRKSEKRHEKRIDDTNSADSAFECSLAMLKDTAAQRKGVRWIVLDSHTPSGGSPSNYLKIITTQKGESDHLYF